MAKAYFEAMEIERPIAPAKVDCKVWNSINAHSTDAYSARLAERDEPMIRYDALMLVNRCTQGFAEEAKQLPIKVVDF